MYKLTKKVKLKPMWSLKPKWRTMPIKPISLSINREFRLTFHSFCRLYKNIERRGLALGRSVSREQPTSAPSKCRLLKHPHAVCPNIPIVFPSIYAPLALASMQHLHKHSNTTQTSEIRSTRPSLRFTREIKSSRHSLRNTRYATNCA